MFLKLSTNTKITAIVLASLVAAPAYSGQVTYPDNTYSTGDTLTAADLNAKFNETKMEVNDNDGRITNNENTLSTHSHPNNNKPIRVFSGTTAIGTLHGTGQVLTNMGYLVTPNIISLADVATVPSTAGINYQDSACTGQPYYSSGFSLYENGRIGRDYVGVVFYHLTGAPLIDFTSVDLYRKDASGVCNLVVAAATWQAREALLNDPAVTGYENSYPLPLRYGTD